jgi:uncharacterized MAPEG superfamily protein
MDSINNSHGDDAAGAIFLVVRYVFILFYLAGVFFSIFRSVTCVLSDVYD